MTVMVIYFPLLEAAARASKLLFLAIGLGLSYVLLTTFYNLLLHPLSSIPGPLLARVSRLWTRIGNYSGRKSHRIHGAHQKYGAVVRIGPNELSFASPAAVRQIYASDAFVKEETFYRAKRVFHEEMLMSFRDQEAHKQRRKLLSRGFSQASMLDFEGTMSTKIQILMDRWAAIGTEGKPIDVYPWCLWLGFDTVYHLMFDEDPGSLKQGRTPKVMKYLRAWRPLFTYKEFVPLLEKYGVYMPGNVGKNFRLVQEWKAMAVGLIQTLRSRGTKTPFLRHALAEEDGHLGRHLTDSELAEESMGGMFGGTGTTANTFAYLLWAVLRKSEVATKLRQELHEASDSAKEPLGYTALSKLPFLQACLNETLRLYPTIIATLPRTALRDTNVCEVQIPCGTIVGTQNYTIHRDPEAFAPDPESFRPDRWLDAEGQLEDASIMKEAFVPFSVGSRRCVGLPLAVMELVKVTAAFFLRFQHAEVDASMHEEAMDMFDQFSASPRGGNLVVRLWE